MKKLMAFTAIALAMSMTPALADHHEGGEGGPHGGGMFEKHDTNGDGVMTEEEFLAHAKERFSKMDTDGDGKVSKEEAEAKHEEMRAKMMEKRKERIEKRMEKPEGESSGTTE